MGSASEMASGQIDTTNSIIGVLTTSSVTYYTVPAGKTAIFINVKITNADTVSRITEGIIVDQTVSPAVGVYVWKEATSSNPLDPGITEEYTLTNLPARWELKLKGSANSVLHFFVSITERED